MTVWITISATERRLLYVYRAIARLHRPIAGLDGEAEYHLVLNELAFAPVVALEERDAVAPGADEVPAQRVVEVASVESLQLFDLEECFPIQVRASASGLSRKVRTKRVCNKTAAAPTSDRRCRLLNQ